MRSLAGVFVLFMLALLWPVVQSCSINERPTRWSNPDLFPPSETTAGSTGGPAAYRLKRWSERDAVGAITEAERVLSQVYQSDFDSQFAARLYLTTIMQEAFARFPATQRQDRLLWDYIREEIDQQYGSQPGALANRFLRALEKALNTGQIKMAGIEDWLKERGFRLISQHPARNVYGDGWEGALLQIERDRFPFLSDLFVIVEGLQQGEYHLTSVRPNWNSLFEGAWEFETIEVKDHNGNGRPEISLASGIASPRKISIRLYLYEWVGERHNGHFENVVENVDTWGYFWDRVNTGNWEFGNPDSEGAEPLFIIMNTRNPIGWPCPDYEFGVRYEWDGQKYARVRSGVIPPSRGQPSKCFAGWALAAANHTLYDDAIPLVVSILRDWPPEVDQVWGPSSKDYFRFKLGTWYAFADDYNSAIATLTDVQDHRADGAHDMVSRMADVFLSRYQNLTDADNACNAVVEFVNGDFDRIAKGTGGTGAAELTISRWGFADPEWRYEWNPDFSDLCNRGGREDLLTRQAPIPTPESITSSQATPIPAPWELEIQMAERIESIEETIFTNGDSRQAAVLVRGLAAEPILPETYKGSREVKPHLLYLLALSSELAGDNTGAVAAYWQILHEYPKSHYAAMARRKLEPLTPQARTDLQAPEQ